ncbi:hypothetical protein ATKI12_0519 [Kitasatospora sp. Ki12]
MRSSSPGHCCRRWLNDIALYRRRACRDRGRPLTGGDRRAGRTDRRR